MSAISNVSAEKSNKLHNHSTNVAVREKGESIPMVLKITQITNLHLLGKIFAGKISQSNLNNAAHIPGEGYGA